MGSRGGKKKAQRAAQVSAAPPDPLYLWELGRVALAAIHHADVVIKKSADVAGKVKRPAHLVIIEPGLLTHAFDALNYAAKVRNLLFSTRTPDSTPRAAALRTLLGIGPLPTIQTPGNKSVRNALEHFDEQLDDAVTRRRGNRQLATLLDMGLSDRGAFENPGGAIDFLRVLLCEDNTLVVGTAQVSLDNLRSELEQVRAAVEKAAPGEYKKMVSGGGLLLPPGT